MSEQDLDVYQLERSSKDAAGFLTSPSGSVDEISLDRTSPALSAKRREAASRPVELSRMDDEMFSGNFEFPTYNEQNYFCGLSASCLGGPFLGT